MSGNHVVGEAIQKRAKRAIIASQRARRIARLAQIPFGSAQGKLSLRKERLFRMTIKARLAFAALVQDDRG